MSCSLSQIGAAIAFGFVLGVVAGVALVPIASTIAWRIHQRRRRRVSRGGAR